MVFVLFRLERGGGRGPVHPTACALFTTININVGGDGSYQIPAVYTVAGSFGCPWIQQPPPHCGRVRCTHSGGEWQETPLVEGSHLA